MRLMEEAQMRRPAQHGAASTAERDRSLNGATVGNAIIYNEFLRELGGGERSTMAYAKALQELGYTVEILSTNALPPVGTLVGHFGEEFSSVPVTQVGKERLAKYIRSQDLALFVNHTFMSFVPNPAPMGMYVQMFPSNILRADHDHRQIAAIRTYPLVVSISEFTRSYTRLRWAAAVRKLVVLRPPLGGDVIERGRALARGRIRKVRQFVHVGRFNPNLHNKNQLLIIETFCEAVSRHPVLREWRLILAGTLTSDAIAHRYYDRCVEAASKSQGLVSLRPNVPAVDLANLLSESFGYVHATGAFLPSPVRPECCEHFGLAIVESMAHGCLPLAYARGGIWEIVKDNPGVRRYGTRTELIDGYADVTALYDSAAATLLQTRNIEQALALDFDTFKRDLAGLLAAERDRLSRGQREVIASAPEAGHSGAI